MVGCAAYVSGGSVAQPMSRLENWSVMLISAFNHVEVEVETERGKKGMFVKNGRQKH